MERWDLPGLLGRVGARVGGRVRCAANSGVETRRGDAFALSDSLRDH